MADNPPASSTQEGLYLVLPKNAPHDGQALKRKLDKEALHTSFNEQSVGENDRDSLDELLPQAIAVILNTSQASVSLLQRKLRLNYSRAARIMDQMEQLGIIGPFEGSKPREILLQKSELEEYIRTKLPVEKVKDSEQMPPSADTSGNSQSNALYAASVLRFTQQDSITGQGYTLEISDNMLIVQDQFTVRKITILPQDIVELYIKKLKLFQKGFLILSLSSGRIEMPFDGKRGPIFRQFAAQLAKDLGKPLIEV